MFVTVLPVANPSYYCSPKDNTTSTSVIAERVLQLVSGFGLSINGQHTFCGDYIFSGHTVALTLSYLIIAECKLKKVQTIRIFYILRIRSTLEFIFPFISRFTQEIPATTLAILADVHCRRSSGSGSTRPLHYRCYSCLLCNNKFILDVPYDGKQHKPKGQNNCF